MLLLNFIYFQNICLVLHCMFRKISRDTQTHEYMGLGVLIQTHKGLGLDLGLTEFNVSISGSKGSNSDLTY